MKYACAELYNPRSHLNPITKDYLSGIPDLDGQKAIVFCTKDINPKWTGGNQSTKKMTKIVNKKGGKVLGSGIITWKKKDPSEDMPDRVRSIWNLI